MSPELTLHYIELLKRLDSESVPAQKAIDLSYHLPAPEHQSVTHAALVHAAIELQPVITKYTGIRLFYLIEHSLKKPRPALTDDLLNLYHLSR